MPRLTEDGVEACLANDRSIFISLTSEAAPELLKRMANAHLRGEEAF